MLVMRFCVGWYPQKLGDRNRTPFFEARTGRVRYVMFPPLLGLAPATWLVVSSVAAHRGVHCYLLMGTLPVGPLRLWLIFLYVWWAAYDGRPSPYELG